MTSEPQSESLPPFTEILATLPSLATDAILGTLGGSALITTSITLASLLMLIPTFALNLVLGVPLEIAGTATFTIVFLGLVYAIATA